MTYGIPTYTTGDGRRMALPDPSAWGAPPRTDVSSGTTGNLGGQLGRPQDTSTLIGRNADGSPIVPERNPYNWTYGSNPSGTRGQTSYTSGAGTGASWGTDGYHLPSGEVLPSQAHSTVDINGRQIAVPGYYNPQQDQVRFAINGVQETAMDRLTRRLKDDAANGLDPADPNVLYRELARLADDTAAAGYTAQQSGFVHLDRFQRGANGETGFVNAQGQANQADPHVLAWRQAISNAAGTPPPPSASPAVTAQTTSNPSITPGASVADTTTGATPGTGGGNPNPAAAQTTSPAGGYTGQAPALIMANPDLAYNAVLRRLGIDPNVHGMFTDYLRQHLGGAIQTLLQAAQGAGGNFDFNSALDGIANQAFNGSNWMGYANNAANQALAGLGSGQYANADFSKASPYIQNLLALKAEGMNPVAGSALLNSYGNMLNDYSGQIMNAGGADKTGFMPYFQGSNFYRQLAPQTQP